MLVFVFTRSNISLQLGSFQVHFYSIFVSYMEDKHLNSVSKLDVVISSLYYRYLSVNELIPEEESTERSRTLGTVLILSLD